MPGRRQPKPDLEPARGLDGRTIHSRTNKGSIVLVDFWATWFAPCLKSMPALQQLHER